MQPLAAYGGMQGTLFEGDEPTRVAGLGATPELFEALRVQPAMGRLITADDLRQGAPPVVMISHELWQTRFGSDPNIIGRGIQLGRDAASRGRRAAAQAFISRRTPPTRVALPMTLPADRRRRSARAAGPSALGRLQAGPVDRRRSCAELDALSTRVCAEVSRAESRLAVLRRAASRCAGRRHEAPVAAAARRRWLRAADRVRQRRQPAACAIARTPAGNGGAHRARRRLDAAGVADADRRRGAGAGRRRWSAWSIAWQAAPALAALVPETTQVPALRDGRPQCAGASRSRWSCRSSSALLFSAVSCISLASGEQRAALASTRGTSMSGGARARRRCWSPAKSRWPASCWSAPA